MYGEWLFHTFGILRYRAMQPWMEKNLFASEVQITPLILKRIQPNHTLHMLSCDVKIILEMTSK